MRAPDQVNSTARTADRGARPSTGGQVFQQDIDLWAIIVGISQYQHSKWNLNFAHRDAEELCQLINSPVGGKYKEKHILSLVNDQATTGKIQGALRSFLKKPGQEDIVFLYFACHGTPDPDRPENLYLLTYDTDPNDIAATALPMREINLAIQETLLAKRVIIIADTCHSAAIGGHMGRATSERAGQVNRFLENLSQARSGIALLTSAEKEETSREGEIWGGGHGVFTHFLLDGMRGSADGYPADKRKKDGMVEIGELFEYVRDKVRDNTDDQQHPAIGTESYDRKLPVTWTGGVEAQHHCQLGRCLSNLGSLLDDPGRFRSSIRHFDEAIRIAPEPLPEAYFGRGKADYALGNYQAAIENLKKAVQSVDGQNEASLFLGMAYAKIGESEKAAAALKAFLKDHPDDNRGPWIQRLVAQFSGPSGGVKRALLIGIAQYQNPDLLQTLTGPPNDCRRLREILSQRFGFSDEEIQLLQDSEATRNGILSALQTLQSTAQPDDTVVIYYSGHALQNKPREEYLLPYDTELVSSNQLANSIGAEELHSLLNSIPARNKTVILDTHSTENFVELARKSANYTLFLGSSPNTYAYEAAVTENKKKVTYGQYTYILTWQLANATPETTQGDLAKAVAKELEKIQPKQKCLFFGRPDRPYFGIEVRQKNLTPFDHSQRQNFQVFSLKELRESYQSHRRDLGEIPFFELYFRFGCAFLEKRDYAAALEALELARDQCQGSYPDVFLLLGVVQLRLQRYADAQSSFRSYLVAVPTAQAGLAEPLMLLDQLQSDHRHAVLVGIDKFRDRDSARGAANDVAALKNVLVEKCGFREEDVKILTNEEATVETIQSRLAELSRLEAPTLFFFAGSGVLESGNLPSIEGADDIGHAATIKLGDIAKNIMAESTNLVTILDAGWARGVTLPWDAPWGSRFHETGILSRGVGPLPTDAPASVISSDTSPQDFSTWQPDPEWRTLRDRIGLALRPLTLGRLTIYQVSVQAAFGAGRSDGTDAMVETEQKMLDGSSKRMVYGVLTHALVEALQEAKLTASEGLTYRQLNKILGDKLKWLQPYFVGEHLDERIFSNPVKEDRVVACIVDSFLQTPFQETITLLNETIQGQDGVDPASHLDLGVTFAAVGDYKHSLRELDLAIEQSENQDCPEGFYHRGRVHFESSDNLDQALSDLKQARLGDPDNPRVYYYLGQAILARIERENQALKEAVEAFKTYLDRGTPLGRREEVVQFLDSHSLS